MKMISAVFAALLFFSCASSSVKEKTVDGLIYDEKNCPLSNVSVFVKGKKISETDIYGHFSFDAGRISQDDILVFMKTDYETLELPFSLSEYPSLLYITLQSIDYLTNKTAGLVKLGKYDEADKIIEHLKNSDCDDQNRLLIAIIECSYLSLKGEKILCEERARKYSEQFNEALFLEYIKDSE